jgi:HEPN domain-containing protein
MAERGPADHAETLLAKARGEQATLRAVVDHVEVPDDAVGLHAQQAVEKALKAVLAAGGARYPFTHDIDRLLELVEAEGHELPSGLRHAGDLTPWALVNRYESAPALGARRSELVALADSALTWAEARVETQT